jgi:hypothetical protein
MPSMDNAMSALLPGRHVYCGTSVGSPESAHLVVLTPEWNDLPATLFLRRGLLPAPRRNLRILPGSDSNSLKELIASSFGKVGFRSTPRPELAFSRPLLWAWAPVGLVLAIRFLTFSTTADRSALFSPTHGESRYEHFFASLNLRSESDLSAWIFDRFVLTGPTLFLLAYTVGVWLRHQLPEPPSSPAEAPE